ARRRNCRGARVQKSEHRCDPSPGSHGWHLAPLGTTRSQDSPCSWPAASAFKVLSAHACGHQRAPVAVPRKASRRGAPGIVAQPSSVRFFAYAAGGQSKRVLHHRFFARTQAPAVYLKEDGGKEEARSFVAVPERMILDDSCSIGGCQRMIVRLPVGRKLPRTVERGLQQPFVSEARQTAVLRQGQVVDGQGIFTIEPDTLLHLANSRRALR